jgi:hypothetical protein
MPQMVGGIVCDDRERRKIRSKSLLSDLSLSLPYFLFKGVNLYGARYLLYFYINIYVLASPIEWMFLKQAMHAGG